MNRIEIAGIKVISDEPLKDIVVVVEDLSKKINKNRIEVVHKHQSPFH